MALVGALPTPAWVEAFTTAHLRELTADFPRTADLWEQSFTELAADILRPGGTEWTGPAAEAAQDSTDTAAFTARGKANQLRDAAGIATFGADQLDGLHAKTLAAIAETRADGLQVGDDLSVTDTQRHPWGTSAYEARLAAAREHGETIQSHASQLLALDNEYGRKLLAATEGLDTLTLDTPSGDTPPANAHNGIQLVDNEEKLAPPPLLPGPPLSENRRAAVEYAEKWADSFNPDYEKLGGGAEDCTNFASQVMRAGGFGDVGNGIDDWRRGDSDDWYYQNGGLNVPGNTSSKTWTLAKENHNFVTQHSGRGEIVGVIATPGREGLDPLAPSRAGLIPGDLIYFKDERGQINHVAVYVGQTMQDGVLTDVINQHSGTDNVHNDWMPGPGGEYIAPFAQAEFVHLRYPGE